MRELVARSLTRLALLDLRGVAEPRTEDFAVASALLGSARAYDPANTEVLRHQIAAAFAAGDDDTLMEATTALVRLDPTDTVAQLRLITARINLVQTSSQRLETYDKFLGKQGAGLDPSIRSRLALDAALLAREVGDEKLFVDRLKLATRLDSTNKDAATLAYTYFSQRIDDARGRLELLANLLYADPLDAGVHVQIRDELCRAGAWDQATRFHDIAAKIQRSSGAPGVDERVEKLALLWRTRSPRDVLQELNSDLDIERNRQRRLFAQASASLTGEGVRPPDEVRLAAPLEQLRAAASGAIPDPDALAVSMKEMTATAEETLAILADPDRRPRNMTDDEVQERTRVVTTNLAGWRMLTGVDSLRGQSDAETLLAALEEDDPAYSVIASWHAALTGDHARAIEIVDAATDPSAWLLAAKATALQAAGKPKDAAAAFRAAERTDPLSPLGALCSVRAAHLDSRSAYPEAAAASAYARTIPAWVDSMVAYPMSYQRLQVDVLKPQAEAMEIVPLSLSIKNLSSIPLGLGSGRTIDTRMFFGPRLELGDRELRKLSVAEVVEVDRRLRLMPGEDLRVNVWPESGVVGWILGTASAVTSRVQWRILQGFESRPNGEKVAGPGCLDVGTGSVQRRPLSEAGFAPAKVAELITSASEASLPRLFVAARAILIASAKPSGNSDGIPELVAAIVARYPAWPAHIRILALCELPPKGEVVAMEPFDATVIAERDAAVMRWVLVTRITTAADAFLTACEDSGDADLAQLAALQRQRLADGSNVYALHGVSGGVLTP